MPNVNDIANLVYNITGKNVVTTIVKGDILMENRKITHIDVEKVIQKCKQIATKKWKNLYCSLVISKKILYSNKQQMQKIGEKDVFKKNGTTRF